MAVDVARRASAAPHPLSTTSRRCAAVPSHHNLRSASEMASTSLAALPSQLTTPGLPRPLLDRSRAAAPSTPPPTKSAGSLGGSCCRLVLTCNAQAVVPTSIAQGTPVSPRSILVVGATETLGRQVVRRVLDEGYDVRCLVWPRPAPADFLRDWGATVVNADLSKPETIPATLVGIHTVIDCATGRPEEPFRR